MKHNNILRSCCGGLLAGAMLLLAGPVPAARAQNTNLINLLTSTSWDCVVNGHRQGTALFTFNTNFTFDLIEVIVPNKPPTPQNPNAGARTVGNGGRLNLGGSTNTFVPNPQIFGSEVTTNGFWNIDPQGHVIGFFIETSELQSCSVQAVPLSTNSATVTLPTPPFTNGATTDPFFCITVPTTNGPVFTETTTCYTNVLVCTALTNAISFIGTVTPKRLILNGTTPFGETAYSGGPLPTTLPDISGTYWAVRKQAGVIYREFFTLTPDIGNVYDVSLTGPGYTYSGISMLSGKRIAFALGQTPAIPNTPVMVVRAVVGPFNLRNLSGKTQGMDGPVSDATLNNRERFNIQRVGP